MLLYSCFVWCSLLVAVYAAPQKLQSVFDDHENVVHSLDGELLQHCASCKSDIEAQQISVGFDLTDTYATSVVYDVNGTTIATVKTDSHAAYGAMMQRFSRQSSRRPERGSAADKIRQALRRLNKSRGRPASKDVKIISELIDDLRVKTEGRVHHKIHSVVVTYPAMMSLPGLYEEDMDDALDYLGLRRADWAQAPALPRQFSAAYAGAGAGTCKNASDAIGCGKEEDAMSYREVIALQYTEASLSGMSGPFSSAWKGYNTHDFLEWRMGRRMRDTYSNSKDYWRDVRNRIQNFVVSSSSTELILMGEAADDEMFLDTVREAFRGTEIAITSVPTKSGSRSQGTQMLRSATSLPYDATFLTAQGAAELAHRLKLAQRQSTNG